MVRHCDPELIEGKAISVNFTLPPFPAKRKRAHVYARALARSSRPILTTMMNDVCDNERGKIQRRGLTFGNEKEKLYVNPDKDPPSAQGGRRQSPKGGLSLTGSIGMKKGRSEKGPCV